MDEIESLLRKKNEQEKGSWLELKTQANDFDADLKFIEYHGTIDNVFKR